MKLHFKSWLVLIATLMGLMLIPILSLAENHPEKELNIFVSRLWSGKDNFMGVEALKSNYRKNKYIGFGLYGKKGVSIRYLEKPFSFEQKIATTVSGEQVEEVVKVDGVVRTDRKTKNLRFDVNFYYFPETLRIAKQLFALNCQGGFFGGGGAGLDLAVTSDKPTLFINDGKGEQNKVRLPDSFWLDVNYMPYLSGGIFLDVENIRMLLYGGRTFFSSKDHEEWFWASGIGFRF